MKKLSSGNYAVAEAVRQAKVQFIAAYPITPQTSIYEKISEMEAQALLTGSMARVESEHSAITMCVSASMAGIRVFSATSSQGLALMHEMLHFASGNRSPMVMVCVNRAIAAPWSLGTDQTDTLAQRDTGWMQFYCEDNQEVYDTVLQAYKISEKILLPSMVIMDGFFTSHFIEPMDFADDADIDQFLSGSASPDRFDIENPTYISSLVNANDYLAFKKRKFTDMEAAKEVIAEVEEEFKQIFKRSYGMVETVETNDAEIVMVTSGAMTSTGRVAIESLRKKGLRVGLLKIKTFRPFPYEEVEEALRGVRKVVVIDRNVSIGKGGIFCSEVQSAINNSSVNPLVYGYIAGLAGMDVSSGVLEGIVMEVQEKESPDRLPVWVGGN
ncbi:putative 2-ketoisovalerate ferredoxin oxidoreductase subunit alpha [delta proteobacterium NaphS2]|nr:putative 2-ketoisovalerate ferredoxin oxidoreductase subunit alpha [delta proteobacterium NaphS2]